MPNIHEILASGKNGFRWMDDEYKIAFVREGLVYGFDKVDPTSSKVIPVLALSDEDFVTIG